MKQEVPRDFNLFLFGDDHEGTVLRYKEGWEKLVEMMNNPYGDLPETANYGVDHGDIVEAICTDDKRYDATTTSLNVTKQIDQAVKNRLHIKDKLVCILDGNHPSKLVNFGDITKDICTKLGVQFGTWTARITYKTNSTRHFKHFAVHGIGGTINSKCDDERRRQNYMELALKRKLRDKGGDTLLMSMGHTHKLLICDPINKLYLSDNGQTIHQNYTRRKLGRQDYIDPDHRWYVHTGSFYKLYVDGLTSYAEKAGYDPIELGFCCARFRDGDIVNVDKIII